MDPVKPKGDFTPGAKLEPWQIERVLAFISCKGTTNDETLRRMAEFFK